MKKILLTLFIATLVLIAQTSSAVRLKELARVEGLRENTVVGYGLVVGLAGTGDSSRSRATTQSVANALLNFGINISPKDVNSRNVAAVILTAKLPPYSQPGDKLDVLVSSLGDARSLLGGTLLQAPLKAVNEEIYALAQGSVSVGGFKFDLNDNLVQKNHPTVGTIPNGATVERPLEQQLLHDGRYIDVLLTKADFTTANRVKKALNKVLGKGKIEAIDARRLRIDLKDFDGDVVSAMTLIENVSVEPDRYAQVVINERTGTVVAGGDIRIDDITISHGDLKVVITTDEFVSQPLLVRAVSSNVKTEVVQDVDISVTENIKDPVSLPVGSTIADLVSALRNIQTSTRDIISILQAIKAAGAMHAELIIQ